MSNIFNRQQVDDITAPWLSLCKEQEERIVELEAEVERQRDALQEIAESSHLGNQWAQRKAEATLESSSDE